MNPDISKVKKAFFIGIGGIGISALAKMMLARGIEVSGVNDEDSPKTLEPLIKAGVEVSRMPLGNLPEADLYVYSDAWIYRGPEIIEAAKKTGKPVASYFECLGELAKDYKVLAVAGTHGKTTTTAMLGGILEDAGLDPTVVVGSFVKKYDSNFRPGRGGYLVVEADEYNRHFLNFNPSVTVITNIEADHLDYYKDLADIQSAFEKLKDQSENVIENYDKYLNKVPPLKVPGIHNRLDAAAAYAVAEFLKIPEETIKKSLANFSGTWRRLEKRGVSPEGVTIYDDYAHHPTEIRASLEALREIYPRGQKRLTVVFQPHLYSRTKAFFEDFAKSFDLADKVILLPVYFAREAKDESVSSAKLVVEMVRHLVEARDYPDFDSAAEGVRELKLGPTDVLVTMGAGEAYKVADKLWQNSLIK